MRYDITQSNKQKYVWFRTPKCCSTSILSFLTNNTDIDINKYSIKFDNSWQNYFKFTIIRNPWDRLCSCWNDKLNREDVKPYYYKKLGLDTPMNIDFNQFILLLSQGGQLNSDIHWKPLHKLFPVKSLDFIGRFENLQNDFNIICNKIRIPPKELPYFNKTKHKHYTEYYDDETREIVARKYAKDIEYFGYKFGE